MSENNEQQVVEAPPGRSEDAAQSRNERVASIVEIVATVLLAIATVSAAWCAFQAAKWGGVQANNFSAAGAARVDSARLSLEAGELRSVDLTIFTEWLAAEATDNEELADFYRNRFRDEFREPFADWMASDPFENESAKESPFSEDSYIVSAQVAADELRIEAEENASIARTANQTSDNYVLFTVLFAAVLFFAGVSMKIKSPHVSVAVLGIGIFFYLATVVAVITQPVEFF
jgi:hypothetical protein